MFEGPCIAVDPMPEPIHIIDPLPNIAPEPPTDLNYPVVDHQAAPPIIVEAPPPKKHAFKTVKKTLPELVPPELEYPQEEFPRMKSYHHAKKTSPVLPELELPNEDIVLYPKKQANRKAKKTLPALPELEYPQEEFPGKKSYQEKSKKEFPGSKKSAAHALKKSYGKEQRIWESLLEPLRLFQI